MGGLSKLARCGRLNKVRRSGLCIFIKTKRKYINAGHQTICFICYNLPMTTINPWINFNGNAEEAFTFYKSVFGGEFTKVVRFKDIAGPNLPVAEKDENKIMYIALPIGPGSVLVANDVPEFMGRVNENENRSKIFVSTESKEEAEKIFNNLSVGGAVEGPMGDSPWGSYAGMLRDKYGIEWIVEFSPNI